MKRSITLALLLTTVLSADLSAARRARVVVRGPRGRVTVHAGFPIHRTLPVVVVRPAPVVRVAPRLFLPPVVFGAVVVASRPPANARLWSGTEQLEREDGWTEFTMNVDRRGGRLLLEIDHGPAQISFAEVVFENGETQVVDFNDKVHRRGLYSLLDFANGRQVDHVRIVAKADAPASQITLHLLS